MSILTVCNEIAAKIPVVKQKGYDEGYAAGQASVGEGDTSAWWDAAFESQLGAKQTYTFTGGIWNEATFKPNRVISAENLGNTTANGLFSYTSFMEFPQFLEDGVTPTLDTSGFVSLNSFFANTKNLTHIHAPIDLSSCTNMSYAFAGATKLEKMTLKNVQTVTNWQSAMTNSPKLTDIGQENDDFGYFSASVDLSKTAIDFGTAKMSLCAYAEDDWIDESSFIKPRPYDVCTLTISQKQYDDANNRLYNLIGTPFDMLLTHAMGWKLAIV